MKKASTVRFVGRFWIICIASRCWVTGTIIAGAIFRGGAAVSGGNFQALFAGKINSSIIYTIFMRSFIQSRRDQFKSLLKPKSKSLSFYC